MKLEHFRRGLEWLNDNRPFFTVLVTNLGTPVDDRSIDTACVRMRPGTDIFEFAVNEEFLSPLTDEEVAGVISHEGYHILFSHLEDFQDDYFKDARKRVMAQECICNDNIVDEGIRLPDLRQPDPETGEMKGGLFFGPDVVQKVVSNYTTREVYDMITDDQAEQQMGPGGGEGHLGDLSPEEAKQLQDAVKKAVEGAIADGSLDPSEVPSGSQVQDAVDKDKGQSKKAGEQGFVGSKALADKNVKLEWAKYLKTIDPSAFRSGGSMGDMKTSWHSPRRKMAGFQGGRLPTYRPKISEQNRGGFKPHIVLALDFSGSIPEHMTTVMANLANTIPNSIEVSCCTYSTFHVPYDPKITGSQPVARGGTDFDAIEQFIQTLHLAKYPAVVNITDGQASFRGSRPTQEQLDRKWNWLLISRHDSVYASGIKSDTVKFLQDYVQGI